jgi:hypothetical protein
VEELPAMLGTSLSDSKPVSRSLEVKSYLHSEIQKVNPWEVSRFRKFGGLNQL